MEEFDAEECLDNCSSVGGPFPEINEVRGDTPKPPRQTFVYPDGRSLLLPPGLTLDSLSGDEAVAAAKVIEAHMNAFSLHPYDHGYNNSIPHRISLTDDQAINLPYRRIIPSQMAEVKKLLQDLLDRKVIRKSSSQYASPIVLVRKKRWANSSLH